jgi:hypothetical protein
MPLYEYVCDRCGTMFDEFKFVKDRNDVFHCGIKATKLLGQVYTDPDLSYTGKTELFGGTKYIHSKSQFKRLLSNNNLVDASPSECRQEAKMKKKSREKDFQRNIRKEADSMAKQFQRDSVQHVAKDALTKIIKDSNKVGKEVNNVR